MARQILRIEGKTDYARGITCDVGLVEGGTGVNVVSAECTADIGLRVPNPQLAEEMKRHPMRSFVHPAYTLMPPFASQGAAGDLIPGTGRQS